MDRSFATLPATLAAFYRAVGEGEKAAAAAATAAKFAGKEGALWAALEVKYGRDAVAPFKAA